MAAIGGRKRGFHELQGAADMWSRCGERLDEENLVLSSCLDDQNNDFSVLARSISLVTLMHRRNRAWYVVIEPHTTPRNRALMIQVSETYRGI